MAQPAIKGLWSDICPRILDHVLNFDDEECLITLYGLRLTSRFWSAISRIPLEELLYSNYFKKLKTIPPLDGINPTTLTEMGPTATDTYLRLLDFMKNIGEIPKKFQSSAAYRFAPNRPTMFLDRSEYWELFKSPGFIEINISINASLRRHWGQYIRTMIQEIPGWTFVHLDLPLLLAFRVLNKHVKVKYVAGKNMFVVWKERYDIKAAIVKRWVRERQDSVLRVEKARLRGCGDDCEVCAIKWDLEQQDSRLESSSLREAEEAELKKRDYIQPSAVAFYKVRMDVIREDQVAKAGDLPQSNAWSRLARRPLEKFLFSKYLHTLELPPWVLIPPWPMQLHRMEYTRFLLHSMEEYVVSVQALPKRFQSSAIFRTMPDRPLKFESNVASEYLVEGDFAETLEDRMLDPLCLVGKDYGKTQNERRKFEEDNFGDLINAFLESNTDWRYKHTMLPMLLILRQKCKYFRMKTVKDTDTLVIWRERHSSIATRTKLQRLQMPGERQVDVPVKRVPPKIEESNQNSEKTPQGSEGRKIEGRQRKEPLTRESSECIFLANADNEPILEARNVRRRTNQWRLYNPRETRHFYCLPAIL
ncbi:uncharacterized protein KY384_007364 [Bacidia gigantensis]|uniref:uncharacterized protein n=1 Tax=Bacidia gigantensis TaxID=2732470 RepID=UPI001D04AAD7|nr:uncharacterized protein KY384_007364 [Bacidia gigantensis]KAG8528446.1 hypothetical protein KY384_007364 [Bacidia gigantensis]